jgi:hypothetical protein
MGEVFIAGGKMGFAIEGDRGRETIRIGEFMFGEQLGRDAYPAKLSMRTVRP